MSTMTVYGSRPRMFAAALVMALALQACSSDDDGIDGGAAGDTGGTTGGSVDGGTDGNGQGTVASYRVVAVNLTAAQPMSPPLVALHGADYRFFSVGSPASSGFEQLAEGGDAATLAAEANADAGVAATQVAAAPIPPGGSAEWTLEDAVDGTARFSIATMLVNTNDAVAAINGLSLVDLSPGDSLVVDAIAYDAGTEANSEAVGTMPGPADGGTGFDAARDDIANVVTQHGGIVSVADGAAESVLGEVHRFLNPVMRVTVTRLP